MKELIDKAAVVAEIEKIYNEDYKFLPSDLVESVQDFKDDLLIALDTLEVKDANDAYKQGKQKPKWTDEDEENMQYCCDAISAYYYTLEDEEEMTNWLISLKQRMEEQQ